MAKTKEQKATTTTTTRRNRKLFVSGLVSLVVGHNVDNCQASFARQHNVGSAQRRVMYVHEREGRPKRALHEKFVWIPDSHDSSTTDYENRRLRKEPESGSSATTAQRNFQELSYDNEQQFWSFHVYAKDPKIEYGPDNSPNHNEDSNDENDNDDNLEDAKQQFSLRRLYDQFVGQDSQHNDGTLANATNNEDELEFDADFSGDNDSNETFVEFNVSLGFEFDVNSTTWENETLKEETSSMVYTQSEEPKNNNNNNQHQTTEIFQPLRLRAILTESSGQGEFLSLKQKSILFHEMLSPALLAWSSALRVDPVIGNLTVDVNQLYDGITCGPGMDSGLPSLKVPHEHLTVGIPDTDMIVYISLGFVMPDIEQEVVPKSDFQRKKKTQHETMSTKRLGNTNNDNSLEPSSSPSTSPSTSPSSSSTSSSSSAPPSSKPTTMATIDFGIDFGYNGTDDEYLSNDFFYEDSNTTVDYEYGFTDDLNSTNFNSTGLEGMNNFTDPPLNGTDIIQDQNNTTSDSDDADSDGDQEDPIVVVPQARTCSGDYLAAASFCSTDQYDRPTAALLHICIDDLFFDESQRHRTILTLMHELGHALGFNSFSMAHFRRPDGAPITPRVAGGVPTTKVECTGPKSSRRWSQVPLPSEEILKFRTVRGGVRVAEIVTPSVLQVVRNQFDCQRLTGAELESGESLPLSQTLEEFACIGDHWERRVFSSDLMNPIVDDQSFSTRISTLTLAFFADSGWYQVDLSRADVASGWGRGAGCNFVDDTCIGKNGEVPVQNEPFFCNDLPTEQTRSLARNIHGCTPDLTRKALCSISPYDLALPLEYQYFDMTYGSEYGGDDPLMDFCPVYTGFANGACSDGEYATLLRASPIERFGERNSRCLLGNLETQKTALCLPIACVVEDRSLRIKVNGVWRLCEYNGQELYINDASRDAVVCPDPKRVCSTFYCQYDCLGTGGICDYSSGKCLCETEQEGPHGELSFVPCGFRPTMSFNKTSPGPFHRPIKPDYNAHPEMPHPDSPLNDYYVNTTESLKNDDEQSLELWVIVVCSFGGVLVSSVFLGLLFWIRRNNEQDNEGLWFWRNNNTDGNSGGDGDGALPLGPTNRREKDKMIATVLVDLRINDPNRRRNNNTLDSVAETEGVMTESDASGPLSDAFSASDEGLSDFSAVRSDSFPGTDASLDDILEEEDMMEDIDSSPPSTTEPPQTLIRRRPVLMMNHDQSPTLTNL